MPTGTNRLRNESYLLKIRLLLQKKEGTLTHSLSFCMCHDINLQLLDLVMSQYLL